MRPEVQETSSGAGQERARAAGRENAGGKDAQASNAAGAAWKMCRAPFS